VKIFLILLVLFCSCTTLPDFARDGERICRDLVQQLEKVETREDLIAIEGKLERLFGELVDVLVKAHYYQKEHLEELPVVSNPYDEALFQELLRVYQIEGGREIIERAQREPLIRLDKAKIQ
jgi:hypothetical protein